MSQSAPTLASAHQGAYEDPEMSLGNHGPMEMEGTSGSMCLFEDLGRWGPFSLWVLCRCGRKVQRLAPTLQLQVWQPHPQCIS